MLFRWSRMLLDIEPLVSKKKQLVSDDVPRQMMVLWISLLKSDALPEIAVGGAWTGCFCAIQRRPALGPVALDCGIFDVAVACLNSIGRAADWVVSALTQPSTPYFGWIDAACCSGCICHHLSPRELMRCLLLFCKHRASLVAKLAERQLFFCHSSI